jgi:hypothetical protein
MKVDFPFSDHQKNAKKYPTQPKKIILLCEFLWPKIKLRYYQIFKISGTSVQIWSTKKNTLRAWMDRRGHTWKKMHCHKTHNHSRLEEKGDNRSSLCRCHWIFWRKLNEELRWKLRRLSTRMRLRLRSALAHSWLPPMASWRPLTLWFIA